MECSNEKGLDVSEARTKDIEEERGEKKKRREEKRGERRPEGSG